MWCEVARQVTKSKEPVDTDFNAVVEHPCTDNVEAKTVVYFNCSNCGEILIVPNPSSGLMLKSCGACGYTLMYSSSASHVISLDEVQACGY